MSQVAREDWAELCRWHRATAHAHLTVLRWHRSVGYARHAGVGVDMDEPPALPGTEIEYIPGVAERIDGREMTPDERATAHRLLAQMEQGARDALAGQSTLVVVGDR